MKNTIQLENDKLDDVSPITLQPRSPSVDSHKRSPLNNNECGEGEKMPQILTMNYLQKIKP